MNEVPIALEQSALVELARSTVAERFARERVFAKLDQLDRGAIVFRDRGEEFRVGRGDHAVRVDVLDRSFYLRVLFGGSLGAAEAYGDGLVSTDDLVGLVRVFAREPGAADAMERGVVRFSEAVDLVRHAFRRNTRSGSRRNIAAHYDLGNELFALFLDESRMYSSAVFEREDDSLEEAQARKLERICRRLDLRASDHLLEIGTGWGGMAVFAARHVGCRVTTTTISSEQHAYVSDLVAREGLADRITVLRRDYRDLEGTFDKLVSIEMVEAVGEPYLETFFRVCSERLAPSGLAFVQAITIEDHRYEQALRSVDFIKKHIFPGSFIPSTSVLASAAARAGELRLVSLDDAGPSYAITLRRWRERFLARLAEVRALGYDERFIRLWEFYLAYCEAGYLEGRLGNAQMLFAKPGYPGRAVAASRSER